MDLRTIELDFTCSHRLGMGLTQTYHSTAYGKDERELTESIAKHEGHKKQFKKVFNIFLNHPYDCTLFNCSAG